MPAREPEPPSSKAVRYVYIPHAHTAYPAGGQRGGACCRYAACVILAAQIGFLPDCKRAFALYLLLLHLVRDTGSLSN